MNNLAAFLSGALQITLLDIVLSGDNIGVIALATKDLPKKHAKSASMIGVFAAVLLSYHLYTANRMAPHKINRWNSTCKNHVEFYKTRVKANKEKANKSIK
mgnify:CR=1 FL=1